jgi:hypothetical protein
MQKNSRKNQQQISKIEITNDKISGRGGLAFFLRYVEQIGFYELTEKNWGIYGYHQKDCHCINS